MRRLIILAVVTFVVMLVFASVGLAQETTPAMEQTPAGDLPAAGGPAILLPAVALLLGSGILTYAILRRR